MNSPYFSSPTWWSRSRSSPKLKPDSPATSRTHSTLRADGLVPDLPPKSPSMFGNFTSAIRLKPKKNVHTLAIKEPPKAPAPLIIPPSNSVEPYGPLTSRPYSKAISAVTITDDSSIEPKTPSDLNPLHHRPFVGADPFAAATRVAFSSHQEVQDLDRFLFTPGAPTTKDLPALPGSSWTAHRRPHTADQPPAGERFASASTPPSPRRTGGRPTVTIRNQPDILSARPVARTRKTSLNDISTPSPATTSSAPVPIPGTYGRAASKTAGGPRPQTRPRGMTDTTGTRPSLKKDVDRPSLSRQPSFSRSIITPPETSPPSQELPPVPSLKYLSALPHSDGSPTDPGSSSSSVSFASSTSEYHSISKTVRGEDKRLQNIRDRVKVPPEPVTRSPTRVLRGALSPTSSRRPGVSDDRPNTLKKMPSQPALQRKLTGSPSPYSGDQSLGLDDVSGSSKSLKKQRSFHHHRVPVPPLPYLRHTPSFTPSDTSVSQPAESPRDKEKERQKEAREGSASLSKRRFIPGSIRRGSTSHAATFTFDDDTGSLIIPPSEFDRLEKGSPPLFTNPFGSPGVESMILPAMSTFYDDLTGSPTTSAHFPQSADAQSQDTGPQQILSTTQLLKLEEMLENYDSETSTDPSSCTSPVELGSPVEQSPANPPPFEEFGFSNRHPQKKNSWTDSIVSSSTIFSSTFSDKVIFSDKVETGSTLSFFDQQQHPGYRPRTSSGNLPPLDPSFSTRRNHPTFTSSTQSIVSMGIESTFGIEPNQPLGGLTPPPRSRSKVTRNIEGLGERENAAHIQPLSPPPLRRNPTSTSGSSRSTSTRSSPISSPKSPPPAFKNDPPVKSIMKKPSFLDIYDDQEVDRGLRVQVVVGDAHPRNISVSSIDDSFLDLGRENNSFDTIRTLSVEGPG